MRADASFPHPVLGWRDDLVGEVGVSLTAAVVGGSVLELACSELQITNQSLAAMVEAGLAVPALNIHCPSTFYRKTLCLHKHGGTARISPQDVRETLDCRFLLLAAEEVPSYRPEGVHEEYGPAVFRVVPGDLLGIGPRYRVQLETAGGLVEKPISSIFRVRQGSADRGPFLVRLDSDRVVIELSKEGWEQYVRLREAARPQIHAALVFPALVEALYVLSSEPDSTEKLWMSRLSFLIAKKSLTDRFSERRMVEVAQDLLEWPFERMANHYLRRLAVTQLEGD